MENAMASVSPRCAVANSTQTPARAKKKLFTFQKLHRLIHARDSHMCFAYVQNGICSGCLGQMLTTHAHFWLLCALCANINSERFTFASTDYGLSNWKLAWYRMASSERHGVCLCMRLVIHLSRSHAAYMVDCCACTRGWIRARAKLCFVFWCGSNFLTVYPTVNVCMWRACVCYEL